MTAKTFEELKAAVDEEISKKGLVFPDKPNIYRNDHARAKIKKQANAPEPILEFCLPDMPRAYSGKLFRWHHDDVTVEAPHGRTWVWNVTCKTCCATLNVTGSELDAMVKKVKESREESQEMANAPEGQDTEKLVQLIALKNLLSIREFETALINIVEEKPPYPNPPIKINLDRLSDEAKEAIRRKQVIKNINRSHGR